MLHEVQVTLGLCRMERRTASREADILVNGDCSLNNPASRRAWTYNSERRLLLDERRHADLDRREGDLVEKLRVAVVRVDWFCFNRQMNLLSMRLEQKTRADVEYGLGKHVRPILFWR